MKAQFGNTENGVSELYSHVESLNGSLNKTMYRLEDLKNKKLFLQEQVWYVRKQLSNKKDFINKSDFRQFEKIF